MASKNVKQIKEKYRKEKKDHSGIIAISVIILIIILGLCLTFVALYTPNDSLVEKPEVAVSINIDDENSETFLTKMSFEGKIDDLASMNNDEYTQLVTDALKSVGYEKLTSSESVEYLKEAMKEKLAQKFNSTSDDFKITNIYIDKLISSKYPPSNKNQNSRKANDVANMFKTK